MLFPFSLLYHGVTAFRNHLYDIGYKPSFDFSVPVIAVGNLTIGGTGKTPMIEYLLDLLLSKYNIATLSRGYGRKSSGFRIVGEKDDPVTIGDETYQLFLKYGSQVVVSVDEMRARAIPFILTERPETQAILLDDAFQHRPVSPTLNILLSDFHRPFHRDHVLPAGRLRESRKGAGRADILIFTKCPENLPLEEIKHKLNGYRKYFPEPKSVFFTRLKYGNIIPFPGCQQMEKEVNKVILVTGIANAKPLRQYIAGKYQLIDHLQYPDHYFYRSRDILKWMDMHRKRIDKDYIFLTTEKDMVKLASGKMNLKGLPFYYLPVKHKFVENGSQFDAMVINAFESNA
jgi:tetraacyldisaccharide 4'-kinase